MLDSLTPLQRATLGILTEGMEPSVRALQEGLVLDLIGPKLGGQLPASEDAGQPLPASGSAVTNEYLLHEIGVARELAECRPGEHLHGGIQRLRGRADHWQTLYNEYGEEVAELKAEIREKNDIILSLKTRLQNITNVTHCPKGADLFDWVSKIVVKAAGIEEILTDPLAQADAEMGQHEEPITDPRTITNSPTDVGIASGGCDQPDLDEGGSDLGAAKPEAANLTNQDAEGGGQAPSLAPAAHVCAKCGKQFDSVQGLRCHEGYCVRSYACPWCKISLGSPRQVGDHKKVCPQKPVEAPAPKPEPYKATYTPHKNTDLPLSPQERVQLVHLIARYQRSTIDELSEMLFGAVSPRGLTEADLDRHRAFARDLMRQPTQEKKQQYKLDLLKKFTQDASADSSAKTAPEGN